jgi:long-chain acyl-CoA synthetase
MNVDTSQVGIGFGRTVPTAGLAPKRYDPTRIAADLEDAQLEQTLPGRVALWARRQPTRPALRHKQLGIWQEITWAEYYLRVSAIARTFWELGIRPGDHVAILSDNRPEWLYADLAAQAIGARSVGIYQTSPAPDVQYIVDHSKSRILVCEDQEQVDKFLAIRDETPSVEHVFVIEPRGTRDYDDTRLVTWDSMLEKGLALIEDDPDWLATQLAQRDPREASMVVYTSGTTGRPKGALLCSANVVTGTESLIDDFQAGPDDLVLSYLPLCHVAEKIYSVYLPLGCGLIVHFGESIETVQEDLREVSPTIFLGVPRIWEKMHAALNIRMQNSSWLKRKLYDTFTKLGERIAQRRREGKVTFIDKVLWRIGDLLVFRPLQERLGLRRCRLPSSGAAPIAPELINWFHGVGVPIYEGYGMTELAGASHFNRPTDYRIGTVGTAISTLDCRIADDGEILVSGPAVFLGYLHNEAATREMIDDEGWLHTGDIGEIDDRGFLKITGRKKEILITAGGKNLSPEKIENALKTSPYIKEVVAIGDARKFVGALIQIEYDTVGDWAQRERIAYAAYPDLIQKAEVLKLVQGEIDRCNDMLARVEQVRAFRMLPKELHQDDGELTATQKVRRRVITEKYGDVIESMYSRKPA